MSRPSLLADNVKIIRLELAPDLSKAMLLPWPPRALILEHPLFRLSALQVSREAKGRSDLFGRNESPASTRMKRRAQLARY
jgi:hypothetical protein